MAGVIGDSINDSQTMNQYGLTPFDLSIEALMNLEMLKTFSTRFEDRGLSTKFFL